MGRMYSFVPFAALANNPGQVGALPGNPLGLVFDHATQSEGAKRLAELIQAKVGALVAAELAAALDPSAVANPGQVGAFDVEGGGQVQNPRTVGAIDIPVSAGKEITFLPLSQVVLAASGTGTATGVSTRGDFVPLGAIISHTAAGRVTSTSFGGQPGFANDNSMPFAHLSTALGHLMPASMRKVLKNDTISVGLSDTSGAQNTVDITLVGELIRR